MEKKLKELKDLIDAQEIALRKDTKDMTSIERVQNVLQIHGIQQYLKGLRKAFEIMSK
jgi:hypothetical protein